METLYHECGNFMLMVSRLFINRDKLSSRYIPEKLPHRERQLDILEFLFSEFFEGREIAYTRIVQLIGPIGSGKTSTTLLLGRILEEKAGKFGLNLLHLYTNLKLESSSRFLYYKSLAEKLSKNIVLRSVSAEEQLKIILDYLARTDTYTILTLDEADTIGRKGGNISELVYDLSRINELFYEGANRIVGILIVARNHEWKKGLDPAVKSSLGQFIIEFPRYSYRQILDILIYRATQAIKRECIGDNVLEFISEITSTYANGDIRYALDLLLYSGVLAESEGSPKITLNHVRKILKRIGGPSYQILPSELNNAEKYVILALIRALKLFKTPFVSLSKIKYCYKIMSEERSISLIDGEQIESILQKLVDKGIVECKGPAKIGFIDIDIDLLEKRLLEP